MFLHLSELMNFTIPSKEASSRTYARIFDYNISIKWRIEYQINKILKLTTGGDGFSLTRCPKIPKPNVSAKNLRTCSTEPSGSTSEGEPEKLPSSSSSKLSLCGRSDINSKNIKNQLSKQNIH